MVWPLTWIVIAGTLPGVFIGAIVRVKYLPDPKNFKVFAGLVLLYIGVRIARDLLRKAARGEKTSSEARFQQLAKSYRNRVKSGEENLPRIHVEQFNVRRMVYDFYGERFAVPVPTLFLISAVVGVVGGIYGIGGGAIIAPIYVAIFHLPVYTVAGAALMGTFITSIAGVLFYQCLAPFYPDLQVAPDWLLGISFGLGGFAGMYCGARLQKFLPAKLIKAILAACILFLSLKYVGGYFF